mgnify:CR=1 FL=1
MQSDSSVTRIIHDGSSPFDLLRVSSLVEGRNRQDTLQDGHAEARGTKAYLKQYVAVTRGEPARVAATSARPGLSQQRLGGCSRSVHESCGLT